MGFCDYCTNDRTYGKFYAAGAKCQKCGNNRGILYYTHPVKQKEQKGVRLNFAGRGNMRHLEKGFICHYCGLDMSNYLNLRTLDHKIPKSQGGKGYENLLVACRSCNYAKADMAYSDFVAKIQQQKNNAL